MNKFLKLATTALVALSIWACVDNANKPANSNANAGNSNANSNAATSKAAPTTDALMALDKQANEAYTKGDGKFFEGFLSDKFVMSDMGKKFDKASTVKMISDVKCDVKSMSFDEAKSSMIDSDTAVLVYKTTMDGSCNGPDGKPMKVPSPVRAASVYIRNGDKWQGVWHGESMIIDPKNPPKTPPPPPAKTDDKMASNSNSTTAAAPASDASTDAMVATEKAGWEAWKERDAAKLGGMSTKDLSFVDLFGNYAATKDDTIKSWTGGKCEIKSTNVTDTSGVSLSPTVGFIMFKGSADGDCEGMKIKPVYGTSFYVKEGDTWKLAFGFESPA
jgi:ketosteroid isomerase-like protein